MTWVLALPESVRLAFAFLLILLLPAGVFGACAFALRPAVSATRTGSLLPLLVAGLTLGLMVVLALRRSPATLLWCLLGAAVLSVVPLMLDHLVRRGAAGRGAPSPLPLTVRVITVLFVPLFFLWLGFVEETLHVTLPHVYFFPTR